MKIIKYPERKDWKQILQRPYTDNRAVMETVRSVLDEVRKNGDEAVRTYTRKFDGVDITDMAVSQDEIKQSLALVPPSLQKAIQQAKENIQKFHAVQFQKTETIETMPGIVCQRKMVGIQRVGLYIPGGTAPLFSTVLMLAVPAKIAACQDIILCTPCDRNGHIHPAILYTAQLTGVSRIFKIGGAQAIAAMAYGTSTIPAVDKIFGPGNQYVTTAKQLVQMQGVAIDMPAGPSEVCILADGTADASFIAADLLSQAEHGADSQVLLVGTGSSLIEKVNAELEKQLNMLPRKDIAVKALDNSKAILVADMEEAIALVNVYAAEHLIISCEGEDEVAEKIVNAGSVFIGKYSPESAGDYASGTNHTLPTNGFAKAYSGISVDSFVKKITYQKLSRTGLKNISSTVVKMAEAEGLQAHANAVRIRMENTAGDEESHEHHDQQAQNDFSPVFDMGKVFDLERLVRKNVLELHPYSSARSEYTGSGKIFLDANENSLGSPLPKWYNRYPDPLQWQLKKKISSIKNVDPENIMLGNGSDECIDLLIRAFCDPGRDNIIICPPTYGMYQVCAQVNDVPVKEVLLTPAYQLNMDALEQAIDVNTKMIFFCSPNNPTGNSLDREDIEIVLNNFDGLVVIDEAYINFSRHRSFLSELKDYPNLVVLQTFSKAWGLAALRLGICFASKAITGILNKIKPPYNINEATQELAMKALDQLEEVNTMIREIVKEREALVKELESVPYVQKIYPSDANFILVRMEGANSVYDYLKEQGIIVRNRSNVVLCDDSLRITVGTQEQNRKLMEALKAYKF